MSGQRGHFNPDALTLDQEVLLFSMGAIRSPADPGCSAYSLQIAAIHCQTQLRRQIKTRGSGTRGQGCIDVTRCTKPHSVMLTPGPIFLNFQYISGPLFQSATYTSRSLESFCAGTASTSSRCSATQRALQIVRAAKLCDTNQIRLYHNALQPSVVCSWPE